MMSIVLASVSSACVCEIHSSVHITRGFHITKQYLIIPIDRFVYPFSCRWTLPFLFRVIVNVPSVCTFSFFMEMIHRDIFWGSSKNMGLAF